MLWEINAEAQKLTKPCDSMFQVIAFISVGNLGYNAADTYHDDQKILSDRTNAAHQWTHQIPAGLTTQTLPIHGKIP
jgi:hypothetical protein